MNFGDAKTKAIKLINEWSNKSALTPYIKNADYLLRMPDVAQAAQMEIATVKKIHAVYNVSHNPIYPQGGILSNYDEKQFLGTDNTDLVGIGSQSYYFEVDKQCTVYIEEQVSDVWTVNTTIVVPNTVTSFALYKGLITPMSLTNNIRLRFTGLYPFNMRNRALWAYKFATVSDVPDYRPYVKYPMPSNCMEIKKIVNETDNRQYQNFSDYFIEGKTTVVINYFYQGSFRVEYYQYPTTIDANTLDTFVLELDQEACELVPYYMAASVLMDDKESRAFGVIRLNEYQAKLGNLSTQKNESNLSIIDTTGW